MRRIVLRVALAAMPLGLCAGCAHLTETKAITAFATALNSEDYQTLKTVTTGDFVQRALRNAEAVDDFEILHIPTGEVSIVEVQDEAPDKKLVTVTIGESKRKVFYRLAYDKAARKWLVDDIYLRQRKGGVKVDRSVAEQMDLLLSVREFLATWDTGTRDEALTAVTPELADVLRELRPEHFRRLSQTVVADSGHKGTFRPKAQLDSDVAIVTLPRPTGRMILNLKLLDGRWKVSDVAVESKQDKEHIASVKKMALAMRSVTKFLDAYNTGNKPGLKTVCHPKFYDSGLLPANLSTVPLPDGALGGAEYYVKLEGQQADYVIEQPERVIRLSMSRADTAAETTGTEPEYLIEEVTLYKLDPGAEQVEEKRLSVVFTGQAVVQIFQEAVRDANLAMIRMTSTTDFNNRVWSKVAENDVNGVSPPVFGSTPEKILDTEFNGAVSRMTVRQGGFELTYVLVDHRGEVRVDDVQMAASGEAVSMKETMELLLPIHNYAKSLAAADLNALKRNSSRELNRLVWSQADTVPSAGKEAVEFLSAAFASVEEVGKDQLMVTLGDESFGAKVLMVVEDARRVIDDIVLINGVQPEQRALLKRTMRTQISYYASQNTPSVLTADQTEPARPLTTEVPPSVEQASYETVEMPPQEQPQERPLEQSAMSPATLQPLPEPRSFPAVIEQLPTAPVQLAEPTEPVEPPKQAKQVESAEPTVIRIEPSDDAFAAPPDIGN